MKQGNKSGGGPKTNENGLDFEEKASTRKVINKSSKYTLKDMSTKGRAQWPERFSILDADTGQIVGQHYKKGNFNNEFLKAHSIDVTALKKEGVLSKQMEPDSVIVVGWTINIIEHKSQKTAGSVDEKLQSFPYKYHYYKNLIGLKDKGFKVVYIYVLEKDFFDKPAFKDTYDYMNTNGCKYFFDELPLSAVGL